MMHDRALCTEDNWVRAVKDFVRKNGGKTTTRALGKATGLDCEAIKRHHGSLSSFLFRHPRVFLLTPEQEGDQRNVMKIELVDSSSAGPETKSITTPATPGCRSDVLLLHTIEILMDGPLSSRSLGMELQARKGLDPNSNVLLEIKQQSGSLVNFVYENSQYLRKIQGEGSTPNSKRRSYFVGLTEQELVRTETLRQIMLALVDGPTPLQKFPYIESSIGILELVRSFPNLFVIILNTKNKEDPIVQLTALAALKVKLWLIGEKTSPFSSSTSDLSDSNTANPTPLVSQMPEHLRRSGSLEVKDLLNFTDVQKYGQSNTSFHTSLTSMESGLILWKDDDIVNAIRKILVNAGAPVLARELGKELQAQGYLQSIKLRYESLGHFVDKYPQFSRVGSDNDYEISLSVSTGLVTGLSLDFARGSL